MENPIESNRGKSPFVISILLTSLGSLLRLVPLIPNSSPINAVHLYSGSKVQGWAAWYLPLGLMFLTDLLLSGPLWQMGFHAFSLMTPVIYFSLLVNVAIGRKITKDFRIWKLPLASLAGSIQFFLITNFAVWLGSSETFYAKNLTGLMECYLAGLAFCNYGAGFLFDLVWCVGLFGLHYTLENAANSSRIKTNEICRQN